MSLESVELAAGAAVSVIGVVVLGWRTWGPGLQDADEQRRREDEARAHFDVHGRWPEDHP